MDVLIVESRLPLASLWQAHLERQGVHVLVADTADRAVAAVSATHFDVIVMDLVLADGSALAVADYVQYRRPDAKIIFVSDTSFFSDGSIFSMIPNAAGFLPAKSEPGDIAALVEHHGRVA